MTQNTPSAQPSATSRFAIEALLRQSKAICEGGWLGTMAPVIPSAAQLAS